MPDTAVTLRKTADAAVQALDNMRKENPRFWLSEKGANDIMPSDKGRKDLVDALDKARIEATKMVKPNGEADPAHVKAFHDAMHKAIAENKKIKENVVADLKLLEAKFDKPLKTIESQANKPPKNIQNFLKAVGDFSDKLGQRMEAIEQNVNKVEKLKDPARKAADTLKADGKLTALTSLYFSDGDPSTPSVPGMSGGLQRG